MKGKAQRIMIVYSQEKLKVICHFNNPAKQTPSPCVFLTTSLKDRDMWEILWKQSA